MKKNKFDKKIKTINLIFNAAVLAYTIISLVPKFDKIQNVDDQKLVSTVEGLTHKFINE